MSNVTLNINSCIDSALSMGLNINDEVKETLRIWPVLDIVKAMYPVLTSEEPRSASIAIYVLSHAVIGRYVDSDSLLALFKFLSTKTQRISTVDSAVEATSLVFVWHITNGKNKNSMFTLEILEVLIKGILLKIQVQSMFGKSKASVYDIFENLFTENIQSLLTEELLQSLFEAFVMAIEGEREPELVLRSFELFRKIFCMYSSSQLQDNVESFFLVLSSYFPIVFTPPTNCKVTRTQLSTVLSECLALPIFHELCIPLILDKMSSPAMIIKEECVKLLKVVLSSSSGYAESLLKPYITEVLTMLRNEVIKLSQYAVGSALVESANGTLEAMDITRSMLNLVGLIGLRINALPDVQQRLEYADALLSPALSVAETGSDSSRSHAALVHALARSGNEICSNTAEYLLPMIGMSLLDINLLALNDKKKRDMMKLTSCLTIISAIFSSIEVRKNSPWAVFAGNDSHSYENEDDFIEYSQMKRTNASCEPGITEIRLKNADTMNHIMSVIISLQGGECDVCSNNNSSNDLLLRAIEIVSTYISIRDVLPPLTNQYKDVNLFQLLIKRVFSSEITDSVAHSVISSIANVARVEPELLISSLFYFYNNNKLTRDTIKEIIKDDSIDFVNFNDDNDIFNLGIDIKNSFLSNYSCESRLNSFISMLHQYARCVELSKAFLYFIIATSSSKNEMGALMRAASQLGPNNEVLKPLLITATTIVIDLMNSSNHCNKNMNSVIRDISKLCRKLCINCSESSINNNLLSIISASMEGIEFLRACMSITHVEELERIIFSASSDNDSCDKNYKDVIEIINKDTRAFQCDPVLKCCFIVTFLSIDFINDNNSPYVNKSYDNQNRNKKECFSDRKKRKKEKKTYFVNEKQHSSSSLSSRRGIIIEDIIRRHVTGKEEEWLRICLTECISCDQNDKRARVALALQAISCLANRVNVSNELLDKVIESESIYRKIIANGGIFYSLHAAIAKGQLNKISNSNCSIKEIDETIAHCLKFLLNKIQENSAESNHPALSALAYIIISDSESLSLLESVTESNGSNNISDSESNVNNSRFDSNFQQSFLNDEASCGCGEPGKNENLASCCNNKNISINANDNCCKNDVVDARGWQHYAVKYICDNLLSMISSFPIDENRTYKDSKELMQIKQSPNISTNEKSFNLSLLPYKALIKIVQNVPSKFITGDVISSIISKIIFVIKDEIDMDQKSCAIKNSFISVKKSCSDLNIPEISPSFLLRNQYIGLILVYIVIRKELFLSNSTDIKLRYKASIALLNSQNLLKSLFLHNISNKKILNITDNKANISNNYLISSNIRCQQENVKDSAMSEFSGYANYEAINMILATIEALKNIAAIVQKIHIGYLSKNYATANKFHADPIGWQTKSIPETAINSVTELGNTVFSTKSEDNDLKLDQSSEKESERRDDIEILKICLVNSVFSVKPFVMLELKKMLDSPKRIIRMAAVKARHNWFKLKQ